MSILTLESLNRPFSPLSPKIGTLSTTGHFGYAPNWKGWEESQPYVTRNLICVVLRAPKFFNYMDTSGKSWTSVLTSLLSTHAQTIDGFNAGLTVEVSETPIGGAGEMHQEVTNVTRARSTPTFTFTEKHGLPIQTFLYNWISYGLMDPDTKYKLFSSTKDAGNLEPTVIQKLGFDLFGVFQEEQDTIEDIDQPHWKSATCLFFEPDPSHSKVVKAWVTANMFPLSTGDIIGKRDMTAGNEINELSIEFSGFSQFGVGPTALAQSILDNISIVDAIPTISDPVITEVDPDVAAETNKNYKSTVDALRT